MFIVLSLVIMLFIGMFLIFFNFLGKLVMEKLGNVEWNGISIKFVCKLVKIIWYIIFIFIMIIRR